MKAITKKAARTLDAILAFEGIEEVGDHAKVTNNETYMPLSIEAIGSWEYTSKEPYPPGCEALEISLCHYGECNGDAMRDPEVCLLRVKSAGEYQYYPYYYRNDYIPCENVYRTPEKACRNPKMQADLCVFVNQWVQNILLQQYKGTVPTAPQKNQTVDINALQQRMIAIQKAQIERERIEREAARRRDAPPIAFSNARGIEKSEEARQKAHALASKKFEKMQRIAKREAAKASLPKNISGGVVFASAPAWMV